MSGIWFAEAYTLKAGAAAAAPGAEAEAAASAGSCCCSYWSCSLLLPTLQLLLPLAPVCLGMIMQRLLLCNAAAVQSHQAVLLNSSDAAHFVAALPDGLVKHQLLKRHLQSRQE